MSSKVGDEKVKIVVEMNNLIILFGIVLSCIGFSNLFFLLELLGFKIFKIIVYILILFVCIVGNMVMIVVIFILRLM